MSAEMVHAASDFLHSVVGTMQSVSLRNACEKVLADHRFVVCTAARKKHQAYDGGLVVHTAEVLDVALRMAAAPSVEVDRDVLITATIYHDYGKIYDYQPPLPGEKEKYSYTKHQELIRHLPHSYAMFMHETHGLVDDETRDKIGHAILAHHGRREWGSPVEPLTTEAHLIHMADMVSAFCSKDEYTR